IIARRWLPATGRPVALAILSHGLGEHAGFYLPVTQYLLSRDMAVYAHDHRGFGHSDGRRGHIERYEHYVEDLRAMVDRARAEYPGLPVVLIGHSMGGTIALLFSQRYPDRITHAVYSAPALILRRRVPPLQRALAGTMSRLRPTYTNTGTIDPTVLTRDPAMQQEVRADRWRHARVSARLFVELFVRGPRDVFAHLERLRVPFLIIHGTADPLVSPAGSRRVFHGSTAPGRAIRIYPGLLHEPLRELEREQVFADIAAWLEEHGALRATPR
ncbi:MAG TPA: lysophospholipase, partial [Chloroflexota bacterium]|nr:lysophospholipase [Chloroflexota bacterium]